MSVFRDNKQIDNTNNNPMACLDLYLRLVWFDVVGDGGGGDRAGGLVVVAIGSHVSISSIVIQKGESRSGIPPPDRSNDIRSNDGADVFFSELAPCSASASSR